MSWFTQKKPSRPDKTRPNAWYSEALWREGKKTVFTITLGYLTDEERKAAEGRLRALGKGLLATIPMNEEPLVIEGITGPVPRSGRPGDMLFTKAEIRQAALVDVTLDGLVRALDRGDIEDKIRDGRYGELTLAEFVSEVFGPIRSSTQTPRNWGRELGLWKAINAVLGKTKVRSLNKARWDQFLAGMTARWSPRTKSIAQQHYIRCLKYAKSIKAVEAVHEYEPVPGGNDTYTQEGESLTEAEVPIVIAHAGTEMHRALFATAIGQGTRPDEVVKAVWTDVNWEKRTMRFAGFAGRRGKNRGSKGKNAQAVHWVPMTAMTYDYLRAWWEACGRPRDGLVFTFRVKPFRSWYGAWRRTIERSGINPEGKRRIIPYSVRYTYATLGAVSGIAAAAMRVGMRHTSESRILERVYQRLHAEQVQSAFDAFPACKAPPRETE